jgi:ABC-type microcin C transport system permease subunit YejB
MPSIESVFKVVHSNLFALSPIVLAFILDIVLVLFLEISYHIPSVAGKVSAVYEGENLLNIVEDQFEHITNKRGMCVMMVSFSQGPGWIHGSKA